MLSRSRVVLHRLGGVNPPAGVRRRDMPLSTIVAGRRSFTTNNEHEINSPQNKKDTPTMRIATSTLVTPEQVRQKMAQLEAKRKQKKVGQKGVAEAAPEQLLYKSTATGTFNMINTVFTFGAFPVHAWGFMTLPDTTLLMFPFAFSLMWLFYSMKRANSTIRELKLLEGHEKLKVRTFSLWGGSKEREILVEQVSPVFVESNEPLPTNSGVSNKQIQAMGAIFSNKRVHFLDIYKPNSKGGWGSSTRYSIDYKSVENPLQLQALWNFAVYASANTFEDTDVASKFQNSADTDPEKKDAPKIQR